LTPRARSRRLRAGVRPLVDERDLPVEAGNLEALRRFGLEPFAVSRWLNRAAVRATPAQAGAVAALDAEATIAPVVPSAPPPPERGASEVIRTGGAKPGVRATAAGDAG